ncbi:TIGR04282 family arsenosugar biosynthesis glycosyltransferase [uncultured Sulfitobacter sp.]|uniref:TIGR04282 family arsenosugar biosynthesis glycosyltransferase n=1 Tax=uncultured Sulfitobacter sp. TaxID=191468 RepID=UPI00262D9F42|nr:TIGR04282 family arsenosugar biosynthesis glycosyltransferase [uncultured Sulfitobacter sp.]
MKRTLVVMLKEPRAGRVKTRLGRDIGMVAAAWWFRHQVRRLLRRIDDPRWDIVLAVSPDRAGLVSRVWPQYLVRIAQGQGDLGDRMGRALRKPPVGPVCVIGGDIPDINAKRIAEAFAALGHNDAVFGPAPDGGYWLIGLRRVRAIPPNIFANVRWSTKYALSDTVVTLADHRIAFVATLDDVDTVADLK